MIQGLRKKITGFLIFLVAITCVGVGSSEAAKRRVLTLETNTAEVQKFGVGVREIFIANPEIADIQLNTPEIAYIFAKKPGSTTVFATDETGAIVLSLDVHVVHNLGQLNKTLRTVRPGEKVKALSTPQGIVLSGEVSSAKAVSDLMGIAARFVGGDNPIINDMTISSPTQVYLKVKVAEVKRTALSKLDINWDYTTTSPDKFLFGVLQGAAPLPDGAFRRITTGTEIPGGFGARFGDGTTNISGLIDILNRESLATVLAEPNLVAISGETASFLAGGEFPFPVPQDQNITIEFKQFGISLAFTPTVLSPNQINLRVRPEVSELDRTQSLSIPIGINNPPIEVPGIKTRRVETSVELGSGESLAIAGLFSNSIQSSIDEFPGLADVPILGAFFRKNRFEREETELVIIVTPYIIKPAAQNNFATAGDTVRHATNLERIFLGRLSQPDPTHRGGEHQSHLMGVAGFYVE